MGLAASQGRLLLLTARKSDLEYQAQTISQERLLLAIQQEQLATDYSDAINNQVWQINVTGAGGNGTNEWQTLTYARLAEMFGDVKIVKSGKNQDEDVYSASQMKNLTSPETPNATLQANLQSGVWRLQTKNAQGKYEDLALSGNSAFRLQSYTQDDNPAKAKYDAALARVQRLDKQLELKLNQVETQHKAVETEIESVDKIIQNNIESSFKYFS